MADNYTPTVEEARALYARPTLRAGEWTLRAEFDRMIATVKAAAWAEGFKQGGPMHDSFDGEPDRHKVNPYTEVS